MLPKIEAAMRFTGSAPGRRTLVTSLDKARRGAARRNGHLDRGLSGTPGTECADADRTGSFDIRQRHTDDTKDDEHREHEH